MKSGSWGRRPTRGYKGTYGNFRKYLLTRPDLPLPHKLLDIAGWIAWNRKRTAEAKRPLSSVTLNTYYRQLRPFFRDLEERDGLPNPFASVPPPRLPSVRLPKARTFEECQHILATAEHHDWPSAFERWRAVAILALFLYAGLRKSEVRRLGFGHVDLANPGNSTILIANSKGEADRVVVVATELRVILGRYISDRRRTFSNRETPPGPAFITSTQTGQGISESTLRRIVTTVRRASGIRFSMHSLRHSFITTLLNNAQQDTGRSRRRPSTSRSPMEICAASCGNSLSANGDVPECGNHAWLAAEEAIGTT